MYKKRNKKNIKKTIIRGVSLVLVGSIVGIATYKHFDKDSCHIPGKHSHLYVNNRRYSVYLNSEEEKINGFYKTNQFKLNFDDYDNENFQKRLMAEGLVPISDNLDLIQYERATNGWENVVAYQEDGEPLTATAGFYAYKYDIETDSFVKSDYVSILENIMDEYPYIKVGSLFDIVASSSITDNSLTYLDDEEENIFNGDYEGDSDIPDYFDPDNPDNNSDLNPDNWFDEPIIPDDDFMFLGSSTNKVKTKMLKFH